MAPEPSGLSRYCGALPANMMRFRATRTITRDCSISAGIMNEPEGLGARDSLSLRLATNRNRLWLMAHGFLPGAITVRIVA